MTKEKLIYKDSGGNDIVCDGKEHWCITKDGKRHWDMKCWCRRYGHRDSRKKL